MSRTGLHALGLADLINPANVGGAAQTVGSGMMPAIEALIELPAMLDPQASSRGRINRVHSRAVRKALVKAMQKHHVKRIPQHFNRYKQVKYGYKRRKPVTVQKKRNRDTADIVKSGKTKRAMTQQMRIRVGGTAASGSVTVTGVLKWPPGMRFPMSGRITRRVMNDEIASFTMQETVEVGDDFIREYIRNVAEELNTRRVSRRVKARVASQLGVIL